MFYPDGHGDTVFLPLGDASFADIVVSFKKGNPPAVPASSNPKDAIGKPNFNGVREGFLTLGCGGELILKFEDNSLVNIEGPDLFVFEVGKYIESTELSISKDGKEWVKVGEIKGGKAAVDIAASTRPMESFSYVKLKDMETECTGLWPGADIDAVAAIGSGKKFTISSAVLFDFDEAVLKLGAKEELNKVLDYIKSMSKCELIIEGHTDNKGNDAYNQKLSESRAEEVKQYLLKAVQKEMTIHASGYSFHVPVADNATDEGRKLNRRVEIIVIPK